MATRIVSGSALEPAIGYCRATLANGRIFVSGTTGTDHTDGSVPERVKDQCAPALDHIRAALDRAGASFGDVVRVTYILPDRNDFESCWPTLRAAFGPAPPAATMIEAGLIDAAMRIEIQATGCRPAAASGERAAAPA